LPARYVPPSGFAYPLDGLLPPSPCRSCFIPTALMGFTLRSFHLSQGFRTFPSGITHLPFLLPLSLMGCIRSARQAAVPGSCPFREFLAPGRMFSTPTAGCSLGFCPLLGFPGKGLERDPSRSPLSRFPSSETSSRLSGASESQSAFASLALVRHRSLARGPSSPFRVSHLPAPFHLTVLSSKLYIHLTPRHTLLSTTRCS
jgi:hypothetical protein